MSKNIFLSLKSYFNIIFSKLNVYNLQMIIKKLIAILIEQNINYTIKY